MTTSRVLSQRAMQELLRGNHSNFISIRVGDEVVHRVHRPVARRFSPVWRRALQEPFCGVVTVTFPSEPPATPPVAQAESSSSSAQVTTENIPPPAAPPVAEAGPSSASAQVTAENVPPPTALAANKLALKFVVQWMEEGGADPSGNNAVPYPKTRSGLGRLLALAEMLEIRELAGRVSNDLERIPARRPKRCGMCHNAEHPGTECQKCWHCQEVGHRRANCPRAYQEYLEREERRRKKAEWEKRSQERQERQEAWQKRKEEKEERNLQEQIRKGRVAVGDAGKVIWRY